MRSISSMIRFISRIAASATSEQLNQLDKIVHYERDATPPPTPSWYTAAAMVGSNEGAAKSAFGNKEFMAVVANHPVATVDEAKALAEGLANDISSESNGTTRA